MEMFMQDYLLDTKKNFWNVSMDLFPELSKYKWTLQPFI